MSHSERIRTLTGKGLSEADATRRAYREGTVIDYSRPGRRLFAVVTCDMSGLGFAAQLHDEGESVVLVTQNEDEDADALKLYEQVGKGWLRRLPLAKAKTELRGENTYWIFTENNFPKVADALRKAGQKVFGTSAFSDKMEHDRDYAIEEARKCGLKSPETLECTSREQGLSHLDANPDTAYVFKPDEGTNAETFVPELDEDAAANEETYAYIEHMAKEPKSYILQERVRGTELNVEAWMFEGEPFFAFATLEAKRKQGGDYGEMAGCAGDVAWVVDLDSELVKMTVGKMFPFYKKQRYTGFADVNVILTGDGPCFLEACDRFGYNAHATLFRGLATDGLGNILADWMDGKIDDIPSRFADDFAASVCLFLDHPVPGLPVNVKYGEQFHPFDGYKEKGKFLLSGFSPEVGIFVDCGTTPEDAIDRAYEKLCDEEAFSYPNRFFRLDLGDSGYPNAIVDRYHQLEQKGLTGREDSYRDDSASRTVLQHNRQLVHRPGRDRADSRVGPRGDGPRDAHRDSRAGGVGAVRASGD